MAPSSGVGRVELEDVTAAAVAGVRRALAARRAEPGGGRPFPIVVGIIAYPDGEQFPWPFPTDPGQEPVPLSARDHTIIIEAIFRHALPLLRALGLTKDRNRDVTPEDALSVLKELRVGDDVRDSIERVLPWMKAIAESEADVAKSARSDASDVISQVRAADSVAQKIETLERLEGEVDDEVLATGVRTAAAILRDGRGTIYDPAFYEEFFDDAGQGTAVAKGAAGEIADADAEGAVSGAVGGAAAGAQAGAVAGGVGAVPGAVAGAAAGAVAGGVGSSAGKAVVKLLDWIFS
jgi:hypothetical protein